MLSVSSNRPFPMQSAFSPSAVDDAVQRKPSKDLEAFNSILPPPVTFIQGSSTGALAVPEGKYEPINGTPKLSKVNDSENIKAPPPSPVKSNADSEVQVAPLFQEDIDLGWPPHFSIGSGLYNSGNTCFLNSALQCLIHTPPLLRMLYAHKTCSGTGFCMICSLRSVAVQSHVKGTAFSPNAVASRLQVIAKHMRRGRQEDAHEFLRYAVDALQKSVLKGHPQKSSPKVAEGTWVHKIFGGRLRSRVHCCSCGYNSDTFDSVLDLSLDIHNCDSIQGALRKFVAVDHLKGADKYKCEKCKKHVNAEKRFTIDDAPAVLTVHLKRFSPLGRKIGHGITYDENLSLKAYMSEGKVGPSYSLYGVICHAGSGPNSGHYYAYVKSKEGKWYEMNDEIVAHDGRMSPKKAAYILFYIRSKGHRLESILHETAVPSSMKGGVAAGMKKRKVVDDEEDGEDIGEKVSKPFIGPLLPPSSPTTSTLDPQAESVRKKIQLVTTLKQSLVDYESDEDDEPPKEGKEADPPRSSPPAAAAPSSPLLPPAAESSPEQPPSLPPSSLPPLSSPSPVPPSNFYGSPPKPKKDFNTKLISQGRSPWNRLSNSKTYGRKYKKSRLI